MYMRKENGKRESPYKGILKFADEKKPQLSFAVVLSVLSSAFSLSLCSSFLSKYIKLFFLGEVTDILVEVITISRMHSFPSNTFFQNDDFLLSMRRV